MELEELKSAWDKISSANEKKLQLNEQEIQSLFEKRTLDISEKIGRNIRIGMIIILAWICLWLSIDFIINPIFEKYVGKTNLSDKLMDWTFALEAFTYLLIIVTIVILWIRYNRIEKQNIHSTDLKSKLTSMIQILNSYKTMFYVVLIIILFFIAVTFSSGFVAGFKDQAIKSESDISHYSFLVWIFIVVAFLLTLGAFIAVFYFLFNLFFNRLYGRYLKQLKSTLNELDEVNSPHD
ncbi:MAG TPA: hypothetical protein PKH79_08030 [Prolixibacteraceae bacterium]|nr:hypothetical protein [Prolixibacteraceae bacterium]HPS13046.1 hypothetical protein [Prolixibacteraceae bacterium]